MNIQTTTRRIVLLSALSLFCFAIAPCVVAQVTPEEHASHHPDQAQGSPAGATQDNGSAPPDAGGGMGGMGDGGMGGMMDGMMEKMGAPKPKEMYPRLMDFPNLDAEQRAVIQEEAHQRMMTGTSLLSAGLDELSVAAPTDDFEAMQNATSKMREGLAQFESGLAAHRAIAEGKSPRNVALQWFKREMNLLPPSPSSATGFNLFGMSLFHSLIMLSLVLFTAGMIWMYFFKMRRASSLLERLASDTAPSHLSSSPESDSGNAVESDASEAGKSKNPGTSPTTPIDKGESKSCCEVADQPCADDCGDVCGTESEVGQKIDFSNALLPVAKRKLCKLRVAKIYQETEDVKTFRLVACNGGPIPFSYLPGQFLTLKLPLAEKPVRRSYTIASSPTQGYYCEITVKREEKGIGSRYLHDTVNEGDSLEVQAPSGKFVFTGKEAGNIVLIAGGVGITPMMSITRALTDMGWPGQIHFVVACRDSKHFIFESELKQLQERHSNLKVFVAMSQMKKPTRRYATGRLTKELLLEWIPDITSKRIHICGPVPMMEAMKAALIEIGSPPENIHTENFGSQAKPKPKPSEAETPVVAPVGETLPRVNFQTSGKSTTIAPEETVLEAAERNGVEIDNSCRVGSCGMCTIKLISGNVSMDIEDGLEPSDKAAGKILACQAKCEKDIVVEA